MVLLWVPTEPLSRLGLTFCMLPGLDFRDFLSAHTEKRSRAVEELMKELPLGRPSPTTGLMIVGGYTGVGNCPSLGILDITL